MAIFVSLIAFAGFFLGLLCVIYPLGVFYITTRKRAMLVVGGSIFTFIFAALSAPVSEPGRAVPSTQQVAQAKPAVLDGCNLAGAIADCKDQVARLAAEQAKLPPIPPPSPLRNRPEDRLIKDFVADVQAEENRRKADESRRAFASAELQRKMDESSAEVERSRAALNNSIADGDAKMRAANLQLDRAQYGVRIEQRNLDRILHNR